MMDHGRQSLPAPTVAPDQAGAPTKSSMNNLTRNLELVSDGLISVPEAAKFLGISKSLLYELMQQNKIRFAKISNRRLIPRRELEHFAAQNMV